MLVVPRDTRDGSAEAGTFLKDELWKKNHIINMDYIDVDVDVDGNVDVDVDVDVDICRCR